jgi:hypothetical protein
LLVFGGALSVAALTGCGDDVTVECLSNDVGEVCASATDAQGEPLTGQIVITSG